MNASRAILAAFAVLIVGTAETPGASADSFSCHPPLGSWDLELESMTVNGETRNLDTYDGLNFLIEAEEGFMALEVEAPESGDLERITFGYADQVPEFVEGEDSVEEDNL